MKTFKWVGILFASVLALCVFEGVSSASDITYGAWKKDPEKDRHYCEVKYPKKENPKEYHTQTVITYPKDPQRKDFYYFATQDNKIWGRCASPVHPKYDPKAMQWSKITPKNEWNDLPKGECPAPQNGHPMQAVIDHIPDPPV